MPSARPSIKEIAQLAGVSIGTVSNVLNHPELVAEATRTRVRRLMDEANFVTNASARQLRMGEAQAVGVVVIDISNPFYTELARGIEDRLAQDDLIMMMCSSDEDPERESRFVHLFAGQQVLGLLVTPFGDDDTFLRNQAQHLPIVLMDSASTDLPSVSVNHVEGARLAVRHLLDQGHRRIGFINGPLDMWQCRTRAEGARAAITEVGLGLNESLISVGVSEISSRTGQEAMARLLDSESVTAVFCLNDLVAMGAMRELRRRGLSVPKDVAVVGYDDIALADELVTPLTSVRQPMHELGWTAADMLLNPDEYSDHVSFAPQLILRGTSTRD